MSETITLSCPSCDTKLIINNSGIKQFMCNTCGRECLIKREGGITYLEEIDLNIDHDKNKIQAVAYQKLVSVDHMEDESFFEGPMRQVGDEPAFIKPNLVDFANFNQSLGDDKIVDKLEAKISKLQINNTNLLQNYKKSKVTYTVVCLVTLTIIYALLPMFDSYGELFTALGSFFGPVIFIFVVYFLINRKTTLSNQKFIDARIKKLQNEKLKLY